jgi:hypothetical protein
MCVISAADVPQVDVIPDGFDWFGAAMGLGGFVAAIVAIVLARRAQRSADTAIAEERRRVFELEILRDLAEDLDNSSTAQLGLVDQLFRQPSDMKKYALRLDLLSDRMSFWDLVADLRDTEALIGAAGFGDQRRDALERERAANAQRAAVGEEFRVAQNRAHWPGDESLDAATRRDLADQAEKLNQQMIDLLNVENAARADADRALKHAKATVAEKLAYDVTQLILTRVEARSVHRNLFQRWWFGV